jgi:histidinol-phosphate/aromatic aminotransferase/cobyric acid decarboxylase-like protein/GNAT superfamily N-acetyltransferase
MAVRIVVDLATEADRPTIYRFRHQVYASELHQHAENPEVRLCDPLDAHNIYLKASLGQQIVGFVSITPPGSGSFSIDKYFRREVLPFRFDGGLYEVRLLTVMPGHRGLAAATLLMYAALRWVKSARGTRIVAIGRVELLDFYRKAGLRPLGLRALSGAVVYELLSATIAELQEAVQGYPEVLDRLERGSDWRLDVPFRPPTACYHGGMFFGAIGEEFDQLERSREVINADVLDAWFPPAPEVLSALGEHLPWLLRTSPPTDCAGLIRAIARTRHVPAECIVPAAGSSELIYLCFREWLDRDSRVLVLDPSYGEYAHVAANLRGCRVDFLRLARKDGYAVDLKTGRYVPSAELETALAQVPTRTRIWLDETYIDYVCGADSLETFAAHSRNVVVCKSMSKVYALSGARAAYLCADPHTASSLLAITPPWAVGLPAQVAAVKALGSPVYYSARYEETRALRNTLAANLHALGMDVIPGVANFLMCHLPAKGPTAAAVCLRSRSQGLFLRDVGQSSPSVGAHALRIAVKDHATNARMTEILKWAIGAQVDVLQPAS